MLNTKTRQLYVPIRIRGAGVGLYSLEGKGVFQDSTKAIGKYALFGLKNLWMNILKPRATTAGKEALKLGKQLLVENKEQIQKAISDESKQILSKLLQRKKA